MSKEQQPPTGQASTSIDARRLAQRRWWLAGVAVLSVLIAVTIAVFAAGGDDPQESSDPSDRPASATTPDGTDDTAVESPSTTGATDPSSTAQPASTVATSVAPTETTLVGATSVPGVTVPFVPGSLATVPVGTVSTVPPVGIDQVADPGTGVSFRLAQLEAVTGEATGPGEIAGPAVRVTVVATNGSPSPVLLEGVVVDLTYGPDNSSAAPLSGPGVLRFTGEVEPGASVTGVYVFDVPVDQRGAISVLVSYLASVSPVVFQGPAPTA